jgi:hypothetical protein
MALTFANFKKTIPDQILTRGRSYIDNILDLSFDDDEGVWEAQVEGTDVYDVRVEQDASGSLICTCTCPYDMGDYCKHVAAVLYSIEDNFPDALMTTPRKRAAKRKTRHDKLREGLEKATREQLVTILLDLAAQNKELLNQLMIHLDSGSVKPTDYRRLVKDALRSGRGEYGYLDYVGSTRAGRKLGALLDQADKWQAAGDTDKAIGIYQAVIDETVPVMDHADDSNGELGECLTRAGEKLTESANHLGKIGREQLLAYSLDKLRTEAFREWRTHFLTIAVDIVQTVEQRALVTSALDDFEADVKRSESRWSEAFELEQIALLRLNLIKRFDGEAASNAFLQAHIHLHAIRMLLIQKYIDEGAIDEAIRQTEAGIASINQSIDRHLVFQYKSIAVDAMMRKGDKAAAVSATRFLWLDSGTQETFALLKMYVPSVEWAAFVDGLIKDLSRKPQQLAWLYAQENRWQELLALAQSYEGGAWLISQYQRQLESRFPDAMAITYANMVTPMLTRASDRGAYKRIVALLRQIKTLGHVARAEALAEDIRAQYPTRRALLDELSRL